MTKNLILWRHAKSLTGFNDHERGLSEKGQKEARDMSGYILSFRKPDLILCSSSQRTIDTLEILKDQGGLTKTYIKDKLYLATQEEISNIVFSQSQSYKSILCIGHNPGIHELSLSLTHIADMNLRNAEMKFKFPTSAVAIFQIKDNNWQNIYTNENLLIEFMTPKTLESKK